MDRQKYRSSLINANYKATFWMGLASVMLVSNLMLAGFVVTADTSEKTIVVPPQFEKPFRVQGNEVSPAYIEQMARYFSQLLLTYHKQNAEMQFDTVLHYTNPSVYGEMKTRFAIDYERISRNNISSVFYLMGMHIKNNVAIISGELNGFIGSHLVSKKQKTYELIFDYNGHLTISGFNELQKDSVGSYEVVKPEDEMLIDTAAPSAEAIESGPFNKEVSNGKE